MNLNWSLLDSYTGLILPLIASATCTFLFRQFFLTVPEELCEAAKMDGASPMTFFLKILLPLSKTNIAALIVIEFVYGYNQYLWPLLITTNPDMTTAVIGLQDLIPQADDLPEWNVALGAALTGHASTGSGRFVNAALVCQRTYRKRKIVVSRWQAIRSLHGAPIKWPLS